jgi:hypothetical protein
VAVLNEVMLFLSTKCTLDITLKKLEICQAQYHVEDIVLSTCSSIFLQHGFFNLSIKRARGERGYKKYRKIKANA